MTGGSSWDDCRRLADALNVRLADSDFSLVLSDGDVGTSGMFPTSGRFPHWAAFAVCRLRPYGRLYDLVAGWGVDRESACADLLRRFSECREWTVADWMRRTYVKFRSAGSAEEILLRRAVEEGA